MCAFLFSTLGFGCLYTQVSFVVVAAAKFLAQISRLGLLSSCVRYVRHIWNCYYKMVSVLGMYPILFPRLVLRSLEPLERRYFHSRALLKSRREWVSVGAQRIPDLRVPVGLAESLLAELPLRGRKITLIVSFQFSVYFIFPCSF